MLSDACLSAPVTRARTPRGQTHRDTYQAGEAARQDHGRDALHAHHRPSYWGGVQTANRSVDVGAPAAPGTINDDPSGSNGSRRGRLEGSEEIRGRMTSIEAPAAPCTTPAWELCCTWWRAGGSESHGVRLRLGIYLSTRKRVRGAVAGGPTTTDESSPACLPNRSLSNRPTDRRRAARHTFVAMHPGGLCALAARGALERELDRAAPPNDGHRIRPNPRCRSRAASSCSFFTLPRSLSRGPHTRPIGGPRKQQSKAKAKQSKASCRFVFFQGCCCSLLVVVSLCAACRAGPSLSPGRNAHSASRRRRVCTQVGKVELVYEKGHIF